MKKKKNEFFVSCIVAAGGKGTRMGAGINKIFLDVAGMPVIAHTLQVLEKNDYIDEIIIVTAECDIPGCGDIVKEFGITKVKTITQGGATRQESVKNGIAEISEKADVIIIHDAARPLADSERITAGIKEAYFCGAAALGAPEKNTLKFVSEDGFIERTIDRSHIYKIHTPQCFSKEIAKKMYAYAEENDIAGTDDCFLAEALGVKIRLIEDSDENIKITTAEDLLLAEKILENRA